MSALRRKLLDVFEVEYREHLEAMRQALTKVEAAAGAPSAFDTHATTRHAHSLKGAARAVGFEQVETLAHRLESVLIAVDNGETSFDDAVRRTLVTALDEIEDQVGAVYDAESSLRSMAQDAAPIAPAEDAAAVAAEPTSAPNAKGAASAPPPPQLPQSLQSPQPPQPPRAAGQTAFVRVNADSLDRLLRTAGELHADMLFQNLNAAQLGRLAKQVAALERKWSRTWQRLEGGIRHGGRTQGSSVLGAGEALVSEFSAFSQQLRDAAQEQRRCTRSLRHHLDDLERRVKSARMMPAEGVFGSFRKMVRDIAASEGKQVDVTIEGLECEADRLVLQRVTDPVMHLLRNAVSHGIEPPEERVGQGKDPKGRVALRMANEHKRLQITVADDGRGIDFRRIADKAVERRRLSREAADRAGKEGLVQLLFESGFSTADSVTKISGRGVGLAIVREAILAMQGTFTVDSDPGDGTRIALSLPVSVLSQRLLLARFRDQVYALPTESIAKVMRIAAEDIVTVDGRPAVRLADSALPLVSIGELLGLDNPVVSTDATEVCVIVVRSVATDGGVATHLGIVVEQFVGVNDFVVRNLELGGHRARLWSGIICTEDGTPCLVLHTTALVQQDLPTSDVVFRTEDRANGGSKVVLVVDDSITTRTLEKSILEAHGYTVRLSVDGRDALSVLRRDPPDVVVSDVEMPHVDGFELVRSMKADEALAKIPVVLVTSRADDNDREKGLKLGADAYIIKQRFDQAELLRTIGQII